MWRSVLSREEIVQRVRELSGVSSSAGPDDDSIYAGVTAFAKAFEYWYVRVVREVVAKYRTKLIARINPFVRRIELEGKSARECAEVFVNDYTSRQFVTAGGWAIETLATSASPTAQKSATEGIDLQRHVKISNDFHLYVVKSGTVTRNSDILKALKSNARKAEQILRQDKGTGQVIANYVAAAGRTSSTFEDGIRRPSSAEFWSEVLSLPEEHAVLLALAMAQVGGSLVQSDAEYHEEGLVTLVTAYIEDPANPGQVDWEYLATRTMQQKGAWAAEDKERHARATDALNASGYDPDRATELPDAPEADAAPVEEAAEAVTEEG